METKVPMRKYDAEFIERMDRILTYVALNSGYAGDEFPFTVQDAYAKSNFADSCATEMVEGNEPEGEVPSEEALAAHAVELMENLRRDLETYIAVLEEYTPLGADVAAAELAEIMAR